MEKKFRIKQVEKNRFFIQIYGEYTAEVEVKGFWVNKCVPEKRIGWTIYSFDVYEILEEALEAISEIGKYPIIHKVK